MQLRLSRSDSGAPGRAGASTEFGFRATADAQNARELPDLPTVVGLCITHGKMPKLFSKTLICARHNARLQIAGIRRDRHQAASVNAAMISALVMLRSTSRPRRAASSSS